MAWRDWLKTFYYTAGIILAIVAVLTFYYTVCRGPEETPVPGRDEAERNTIIDSSGMNRSAIADDTTRTTAIKTPLPANVFDYFSPSGFLGDATADTTRMAIISRGDIVELEPRPGKNSYVGLYWLYPPDNWGERPGRNLTGAERLVFSVRTDSLSLPGLKFKAGGIFDNQYKDSFEKYLGTVTVEYDWQEFSIDLSDQDLSSVIGGFAVIAEYGAGDWPVRIYIKNVFYE